MLWTLGVALCANYNHSIAEFLPKLEAFMLNCDDASLSIDKMGQFEQSLYAEARSKPHVVEKKNDNKNEKKKVYIFARVLTDLTIFARLHHMYLQISPSPEITSLGKRSKFDFVTPNDSKPSKSVASFNPSATTIATVKKDFSVDLETSLSQAPSKAYSQRPNAGQSVQTYNPNLGSNESPFIK